MAWHLTLDDESYEQARQNFEWDIPDDYNIARDALRKHDDPAGSVALFQAYPDGRRETYTFRDLDRASNRMANALADAGVEFGDRVAVVIPQKPQNPITHLACWKLGAISVPLSVLFGEEGLGYRLRHSGAKAVVADASVRETLEEVRADCPDLETVVEVDGEGENRAGENGEGDRPADWGDAIAFSEFVAGCSAERELADTDADTPAIIIYTSGSTGPPKGALHTHKVWLGHCPAFYMYFERDVVDETVAWTPADWAWIGALGDLVFPAWHYGRPVVGYPMGKFDAEQAFEIMEEFGVTDAFLPPTAIRMMMDVADPTDRYDLAVDAICSGGEPLTPEILDWADEELSGVVVNEIYGQTESNLPVVNCQDWFEARPGSMGKPVPGHDVAIVDDETGEVLPRGEPGQIAIRADGNPAQFEGYWNEPDKTESVRVGDWHLTGDIAVQDEEGYVWFKSRDDDLIITSGYRVGPGEVEKAVLEHPSVEQVGVVGVPDETRGEIIKAFVQPISGVSGDDGLREEIRDLVRDRLAKYEYPREIEFVESLPQTTTGKIQRRELRAREKAE
ncbi:AMP-binding protein [Halorussus caseinilyticus]|uniref:AMP-binding protein n=1 Tax=Halorussus caseinilyticus TaxID=3034025 RepID=A0ABD5WPN0_9EURY|nr:AMP-binding protein [Halorussus sp. DT72]